MSLWGSVKFLLYSVFISTLYVNICYTQFLQNYVKISVVLQQSKMSQPETDSVETWIQIKATVWYDGTNLIRIHYVLFVAVLYCITLNKTFS